MAEAEEAKPELQREESLGSSPIGRVSGRKQTKGSGKHCPALDVHASQERGMHLPIRKGLGSSKKKEDLVHQIFLVPLQIWGSRGLD